jgi:hypothetical protein
MKPIFYLIISSLLISACSSKHEPDPVAQVALNLANERDQFISEIEAMGEPEETWTLIQLEKYENQLAQLEELTARLNELADRPGLVVRGGPQEENFFERRRHHLNQARERKNRQQTPVPQEGEGAADDRMAISNDPLRDMRVAFFEQRDQIYSEGFVSPDLSDEELNLREEQLEVYRGRALDYRNSLEAQITLLQAELESTDNQENRDLLQDRLDLLQVQAQPVSTEAVEMDILTSEIEIRRIRESRQTPPEADSSPTQ